MLIYEWECAWLVNITCKQSFWPDKLIAILAGHNVSWLAVFLSPNVCDKFEVCQQLPGYKDNHFYTLPFGQAEASIY